MKTPTSVGLGVIVLGLVGLVMSGQSTSLMNGTGTIWLGVVLVAVAVAASLFLSAATWARVIAVLMLALALYFALYMEKQLDEKRNEIFSGSSYSV